VLVAALAAARRELSVMRLDISERPVLMTVGFSLIVASHSCASKSPLAEQMLVSPPEHE
jgi:hypothetical protein